MGHALIKFLVALLRGLTFGGVGLHYRAEPRLLALKLSAGSKLLPSQFNLVGILFTPDARFKAVIDPMGFTPTPAELAIFDFMDGWAARRTIFSVSNSVEVFATSSALFNHG